MGGLELVGTFGMVASTHWLASNVAMGILERGGNAFDAAAAGGFALQAAQPHQHGPGGDMPVVFWSADERRIRVLCGQGVAPAAATSAAFGGLGLDDIPGTGLLAACVPGVFDGWMALLAEYGTLPLRDIMAPAIGLFEDGVFAGPWLRAELDGVAELFGTEWTTSEAQWGPVRSDAAAGRLIRQPALAASYRRVLQHAEGVSANRDAQLVAARDIWSTGFVAEEIDAFARTEWMDTSGHRHAGLLTGADIAGWSAGFEDPVTLDYGRHTIAKTDAWGQGPVFLQQLALLAGFPLGTGELSEAEERHVVLEASKLAFADREAWYGDAPSRPDVLAELLSAGYSDARRALISPSASAEVRPGSPRGLLPRLVERSTTGREAAAGTGEPTRAVKAAVYGDTVHIDVADRFGNLVSATPSGGWLQSSPTIPELGFCLGTRAQMFWLQDGLASSLAPGTRPRTTLSPSIVLRDGQPWMALGTPGGDQQDQWALAAFLRVVHGGESLPEAIDAPRIHSEHVAQSFFPRLSAPNRAVAERDMPPAVLAGLRARGHDIAIVDARTQGKVTMVTRETGVLRGAADSRFDEPQALGR